MEENFKWYVKITCLMKKDKQNSTSKKVKNLDIGEIFNSAVKLEIYYTGKKSGNLSKAYNGVHKTFAGYKWIYI
ncbi:hypothetical protein [Clostridium botulinum]